MAYLNGTNGVHHEEGLKVIVIGAGISGVATAVALRQAGHRVTIYEESDSEDEAGLVIRLGPNTSGLLKRMGLTPKTCNSVNITHVAEYSMDGAQKHEKDASKLGDLYQHPWEYYDRADLHSALLEIATASTGKGSPVKVLLRNTVTAVDAADAVISLRNGEMVKGDVVLAADGVYSTIRQNHFDVKAIPVWPGRVATNFTVSVNDIPDNPIVWRFENKSGRFETWIGEGNQMDIYCVRKGELIFNCAYNSTEARPRAELKAEVLKAWEKFSPDLLQVLEKIDPARIRSWDQNDIPSVKTWVSNRLALVGDAAHPFLPTEAQGSAHALEDAAALGAVLTFETRPEEVEERLKLYQESRQERVNYILGFTRDIQKDTGSSKMKKFETFGSYTYGHDAHDWATGKLRRHVANQTNGSSQISSGPRDSLASKSKTPTDYTFRTASITFETSKTYLQTFLPTSAYSIVSPGTIALASFRATTYGSVESAGGRELTVFGFYIHNVQVQPHGSADGSDADDQSPVTGRYLPVLFANSEDVVCSGAEKSAVTTLLTTLDVTDTSGGGYKLVASCGGSPFLEVALEGLQPAADDAAGGPQPLRKSFMGIADEGVLNYGLTPMPGGRPGDDESGTLKKKSVAPTNMARVEFLQTTKKYMPTLGNVVEELSGVEVFKVMAALVEEGTSVRGAGSEQRI